MLLGILFSSTVYYNVYIPEEPVEIFFISILVFITYDVKCYKTRYKRPLILTRNTVTM